MARPLRLRTTGASEDFDTGDFEYDGAGNVMEMGSNRFHYDLLSRVVEAEVSTVADVCGEDLDFQFVTFTDTLTSEVCGEILAGPQVTVAATGDVTFRAGERVVLADGFEVASGGRFVADVDPDLLPGGGESEATWEGAYDLFGNLTSITTQRPGQSAVTRTPKADPATNRLVQVGTAYDASGNVEARPGWEYAYDPFNMLWQARRTGGNGFTFVYGPGDERLFTVDWTAGTETQHWVETWTLRDLDGTPLRQLRSEGGNLDTDGWSLLRDYVWRGGGLLGAFTPQGLRYTHLDHLGTPRLVTDPNGATHAYHAYFPFGEEATSPGDSLVPLQYTGHERDDLDAGGTKNDLDYMHARYFSAHLGRFLSPDQLNGSVLRPQSWNRYSYVLGNPMKYVDPFGLFPCPTMPDLDCQEEVEVIGEAPGFDPLTGVAGLGQLRAGRALMSALDNGIGATRNFYQRRFQDMAVEGNYVAAFIDYVGLQLVIPESGGELGGELLLSVVPYGKAGRLARIATRNIQGGKTTAKAVLKGAEKWLGPGYKEVAPGVFRSADGKRQFRMTADDLTDAGGAHVHFEAVAPDGRQFIENAHIQLVDP